MRRTRRRARLGLATFVWLLLLAPPAAAQHDQDGAGAASAALLFGTGDQHRQAVSLLRRRGQTDVAAAAILALRYRRDRQAELDELLQALTGHRASGWFDWMLWQERHPEAVPHKSFVALMQELLTRIDPDFMMLLGDPWADRARMRIRLEEIAWGGVGALTGIPSLDRPKMIAAARADYLLDDDLVFGIEINGDRRAYPLRIMGWHEMFNDVIGGVPVALAYCTLCGSGILYETKLPDRAERFVFGSSGLLYRSNKLMFDWQTKSLWNQFTGEPVAGPLADSKIALKTRPLVIASWAQWRARHPDTTVLSLDTGHVRDYGSGAVYREYFASPNLMFPSATRSDQPLQPKDYVFGMRDVAAAKAWPLAAFKGGKAINDTLGARSVVLIGDAATRTVRAYDRGAHRFEWIDHDRVAADGGTWQVREDALVGPGGQRLARLPGGISYWFAWDSYVGVRSELHQPGK